MAYCYLTYLGKKYSLLTDLHKNELRTENDFSLSYFIFYVTHQVLIL